MNSKFKDNLGKGIESLGRAMAGKAARRIEELRGTTPSDSSINDAAGTASLAIVVEANSIWINRGQPSEKTRERALGALRLAAWRAAYADLTRDGKRGLTGRNSILQKIDIVGAEAAEDLTAEESPAAWSHQRHARTRVLRWLRHWAESSFTGQKRARARRFVRLTAGLLRRRSWRDSAVGAGWANGDVAAQAISSGKLYNALAQAASESIFSLDINQAKNNFDRQTDLFLKNKSNPDRLDSACRAWLSICRQNTKRVDLIKSILLSMRAKA